MNTDDGLIMEYRDVMAPEKIAEVKSLLGPVGDEAFNKFIERVRYPVSAYFAHLRSHSTIPDAKDQKRSLKKLESKIKRLNKVCSEVAEELDKSPFELRQKCAEAKVPIHGVQNALITMMTILNDILPSKSKYRPETYAAIEQIAKVFESELRATPKLKTYQNDGPIPVGTPLEERFVPILAKLLAITRITAYRLSQKILPS